MKSDKTSPIAFFDLDQTMLETSSGIHTYRYMKENNLITRKHRRIFIGAIIPYRLGLISAGRAMEKMAIMFKDISLDGFTADNDRLFEDRIKVDIRPAAVEEIAMHRQKGRRVVLLSASTQFVCRRIADYLNLDDVLCTELEVDADRLTGRLTRPYCHGHEKVRRAEEYCRDKGGSLDEAWYYGDAWADRHILRAVGSPRCVTPAPRLQKEAKVKSWQILSWSL